MKTKHLPLPCALVMLLREQMVPDVWNSEIHDEILDLLFRPLMNQLHGVSSKVLSTLEV